MIVAPTSSRRVATSLPRPPRANGERTPSTMTTFLSCMHRPSFLRIARRTDGPQCAMPATPGENPLYPLTFLLRSAFTHITDGPVNRRGGSAPVDGYDTPSRGARQLCQMAGCRACRRARSGRAASAPLHSRDPPAAHLTEKARPQVRPAPIQPRRHQKRSPAECRTGHAVDEVVIPGNDRCKEHRRR